ncbi:HIT family protein [Oscillospiraceae bacterium MB08-C2-2]|nr:HIT family protein [Oscillospiraceae bacterium MB08-C2-2]
MNKCVYCEKGEALSNVIKICDLNASTVYLFREQTHYGRCVVAETGHHKELFELSQEELSVYMQDVAKVAKAIDTVFAPAKVNYGYYSDKMGHLHFHVVPKYQDGEEWGGTFTMNPNKTFLPEAEYEEMVRKLLAVLA